MDVSRIDPEEVLVDFETVEAGDLSAEIDEASLREVTNDDKVLVSIRYVSRVSGKYIFPTNTELCRIRPSDVPSVWEATQKDLKLDPQSGKSTQEFHFDNILTGSENKLVYTSVARKHVCAAMDGYNSVIFAYGQTASGKTYTLVCHSNQSRVHFILERLLTRGTFTLEW